MDIIGKNLEKTWKKLGKNLEKTWKKVGAKLEQSWSKVGAKLEKPWPKNLAKKLGQKKRAQTELSYHQLQTTAVCSLHHVEESCILHCFPADIPAESVPEDMTAVECRHLYIPEAVPDILADIPVGIPAVVAAEAETVSDIPDCQIYYPRAQAQ